MNTHVVTRPSLELRWLPNSMLKQLPYYPVVVFQSGGGGFYYRPGLRTSQQFYEEVGIDIDTSRGVILVGDRDQQVGTLAHEARHHWQWTNQVYVEKWGRWGFNPVGNDPDDYWDAITQFFSHARHEYDALRFQMNVALDDITIERWIHLEKQKQGFFNRRW